MKKIFYLLVILFSCVSVHAQDVKIYRNGTLVNTYTNGGGINYKVVLSKSNFPGDGKTHDVVDLGLSVKWATCNIGAETAYEAGDYFAWGETSTKSNLQWKSYNYSIYKESPNPNSPFDQDPDDFTKYNTTDGKMVLDPEDDAATVIWGSDFRIPTHEEFVELFEKCTWTWDSSNNGYWVEGTNGNSIFLPVTGILNGTSCNSKDDGYYMSSTLCSVMMAYTPCFDLWYGERYFSPNRVTQRFPGYCVRPVAKN